MALQTFNWPANRREAATAGSRKMVIFETDRMAADGAVACSRTGRQSYKIHGEWPVNNTGPTVRWKTSCTGRQAMANTDTANPPVTRRQKARVDPPCVRQPVRRSARPGAAAGVTRPWHYTTGQYISNTGSARPRCQLQNHHRRRPANRQHQTAFEDYAGQRVVTLIE